MCLIIGRPEGKEIPKDWIENSLDRNPHGWGIMWSENNRIRIRRSMENKKIFDAIGEAGKNPLWVHMRLATHGHKDEGNCHPFGILGGRYAVMHNGIIDITCDKPGRSDTWHFSNGYLAPILEDNPSAFNTAALVDLLEEAVGKANKIVVLRHDGATMMVNKNMGDDKDGLWLSNVYSIAASNWPTWGPGDERAWSSRGSRKHYSTNGYAWVPGQGWIEDGASKSDLDKFTWPLPDELWDLSGWSVAKLMEAMKRSPWSMAGLIKDHLSRWVKPGSEEKKAKLSLTQESQPPVHPKG